MSTNAPALQLGTRENFLLGDRIRGVPPRTAGFVNSFVASQGWHPADGPMSLPVLMLDEAAFVAIRDLFLRSTREQGVEIAPHAKTPMAPDLARSLVNAGAWGATDDDMSVGDVVEFGISHPCTCLDRYRVIFGTDESGHVRNAFPTYFG